MGPDRKPASGERGFTLIELLIALTVLLIGISGILAMQLTSMRSTAYSRHATEATVLAEDQMESLRTIPIASVANGTENVDAQGNVSATGFYTRTWSVSWNATGTVATLMVTTGWLERGFEPHAIVLRTQRAL